MTQVANRVDSMSWTFALFDPNQCMYLTSDGEGIISLSDRPCDILKRQSPDMINAKRDELITRLQERIVSVTSMEEIESDWLKSLPAADANSIQLLRNSIVVRVVKETTITAYEVE